MCERKTARVSLSKILLVAAIFCINQSHKENKVGHHSKIKSQGPCKNEYTENCLNGCECCYLVDKCIVGCNCSLLYGGKRSETYMWWDWVRIQD